jgi:hypothetical protein
MLSAFVLLAWVVVTQLETGDPGFFTSRLYYASRLIGALLIATLVPLLIDRHARRSSRVRR